MLSLAFDRRDYILFADGTYRWLDVKHFTLPPDIDLDCGAVIDGLIDNWRFRDHYASATSHQEDARTIHGPFLVAAITRNDFTAITANEFSNVVREFVALYDCLPPDSKQAEIDGVLHPLQSDDAQYFQMIKSLESDTHEWGFVLWEFRELVVINFRLGKLTLCVMAVD